MAEVSELVSILELEPIELDMYRGQTPPGAGSRIYGGQVVAQAMAAAYRTIDDGRLCHSMHGYFMRPGDPKTPILFQVERVRDGGSFAVRRVVALQNGKQIFNLAASFQTPEEGFEHQFDMPDVAPPESLAPNFTSDLAIDIRPVDPVDRYEPVKKAPVQHIWFRANGAVPNNPVLQRCLLAYASDFSLLSTCLRPHGLTYYQPNMVTASLDHAMWFYRDFQIDDWLLYACDSPTTGHARGLNRGNIFSRDGKLVASVTQEGLVRQLADRKSGV